MATTKKICRTCLNDISCLSAICEEPLVDGIPLYEILNELLQLGVRKKDGFPECVCQECYVKIAEFKNFKNRALAAKDTLEYMKEGLINRCKKEDDVSVEVKAEEVEGGNSLDSEINRCKKEDDVSVEVKAEEVEGSNSADSEINRCKKEDDVSVEVKAEEVEGSNSADSEINRCKKEDDVSVEVKAEEVEGSNSPDSEVQCLTETPVRTSSGLKSRSNLEKQNVQVKREDEKQDEPQPSSNTSMKTEIKQEFDYDMCGMSSPKSTLLNKNIKKQEGPFNCIHCGVFFVHQTKYIKHTGVRDPLMPYKPTLPCDICQKRFPCITFLQDHEKIHRETKLSIIRLLKSSSISNDEDPLGRMYLQKLGLRGPAFYCEICGKRFKSGKPLERHIQLHKARKQFECDVCCKLFNTSRGLMIHKEIHVMEQVLNIESHQNVSVSRKNDGQNVIDELMDTKDADSSKMNSSLKMDSKEITDAGTAVNVVDKVRETRDADSSKMNTSLKTDISLPSTTYNPGSYGPNTVTSAEVEGQRRNDIGSNYSNLSRPSSSVTSVTKDHNAPDRQGSPYNPGKIKPSYSSCTNLEDGCSNRGALRSHWGSRNAGANIVGYHKTRSTTHPYYSKVFNGNLGAPNNTAWNKTPARMWYPNMMGQSFSASSMDEWYEDIKLERTAAFDMQSVGTCVSNPPVLNMIYPQTPLNNIFINEPNISPNFLLRGQSKIETGMEQYNSRWSGTNSHPYPTSVHLTGIKDLNVARNPEPQFKCSKCEARFFMQSNLDQHMKCQHQSKVKSSKKRKRSKNRSSAAVTIV